jgi:membrane-associated phospholipid phosphatase
VNSSRPLGEHPAVSAVRMSRHRAPEPAAAVPAAAKLALTTGVAAVLATFLLGLVAKAGPVARLDLRADEHIAHDRAGALTTAAKAISVIATPEVFGPAVLIVLPLILLALRRKLAALMAFCTVGGALALAEVAKKLISESRPPAALQAMAADSGASYPSGHTAAAAVLAVALVIVVTGAGRRLAALVLAGGFAAAVAVSRVYLGDHYPLDVIGSVLCALAAGFVVAGLAALPAVRRRLH